MPVYRNDDPPDEPEHPECCGELMDIDGRVLRCGLCGHCQELVPDPDDYDPGPEPELPDEVCEGPPNCPHGNAWGECDACDYLGDLAYDAARERR